jgi:hypothetical protein
MAVQMVVSLSDIPVATSVSLLFQQLGSTIAVAVAQAVLLNQLLPGMQDINPNLTSKDIIAAGATGLKELVMESQLPIVLRMYASGLDGTFKVAAAFSGVGLLASLGIEWKNIKKGKQPIPK